MLRSSAVAIALAAACVAAPRARGEHAKITLDASAGEEQKTAFMDQTPPEFGKNPRPVLKVKAGRPIKVQWVFTNLDPHKTMENVVIHSYVARQGKVGQKDLPDLSGDVAMETAFEMDFKPGSKAGARSTLKLDEPGAYLLRIESRQTKSDHEHFAAIDLLVE